MGYSDETYEKLPLVMGGMGLALARSFRIIDSELKNPQTQHWERAFALFGLLV